MKITLNNLIKKQIKFSRKYPLASRLISDIEKIVNGESGKEYYDGMEMLIDIEDLIEKYRKEEKNV